MSATFRYLITASVLCVCMSGAHATDGEVTYTNPRAQAISNLLQALAAENKSGDVAQNLTKEELQQLMEQQEPEEKPDPYRNPQVTPVQVAPRAAASEKDKKDKYQPNSINKTGGIGNVGGLGRVGSPNVKAQ
ncbi:MAG: hypothetical protein AB7L92_02310 [Alphaproteobacteria bacterium]